MIMADLVSIIIPVFNSENYLDRCINSVLNQTYDNLDVILVNDGSTDNSLKICKKYELKDKRVTVINQNNLGVSSARNAGIGIAKGKFIQFVDSDDFIEPEMTEIMVSIINKDHSDIVICGLKRISKDIARIKRLPCRGKFSIEIFIAKSSEVICDNIIGSPCNKLYKQEIINNNNIRYDYSVHFAEDLIFNYNYFRNTNTLSIIGEPLYNYAYSSDHSLTSKFRSDCYESAKSVYNETVLLLEEFNVGRHVVKNKFANIFVSLVYHVYREDSTLSFEEKKELIKKEFYNEPVTGLVNGSKLYRKIDYVILFLITKEHFRILNFLLSLINLLKRNATLYRYAKRCNVFRTNKEGAMK